MDVSGPHDFVVVGAGPAGAAFVRTLRDAEPDARVLVVDKARFPRDKVCGDALTHTSAPLVLEIFPELADRLPTRSATRRYTLRYPNGRVFSRTDQELDVIPRLVLDDMLWQAARHDGVTALEGARVVDVARDDAGAVCGVVADHDGQRLTLRATTVVAADGSASTVRRRTRVDPDPPPSAVRQYVRGVPPTDDGLVFLIDPDHHGYFWFFPIVDDDGWSANVGWFGFGPRGTVNPRIRLEAYLAGDETVRRYVGDGRREGTVQGFPINLATLRGRRLVAGEPLWGDGYLLAGDAAGVVHPFTGEGIAFALRSGQRAAELLARSDDAVAVGPTYEADVLRFADDVYGMTRTNMLFHIPCVLPPALRSPYLGTLPALDRARKAVKRGKRAIRRDRIARAA